MFIPYAGQDHDAYAKKVKGAFSKWGIEVFFWKLKFMSCVNKFCIFLKDIGVESIHMFENKLRAVQEAQALFIGGGNTFLLLTTLYSLNIFEAIRKKVLLVR